MKSTENLKFLCSYGGRIVPRPSDGLLRYKGGHTRVLSVPRSISYSELMKKLFEMCGYESVLRCQMPGEDMDDVLVSIKSDEDLENVIDEYNRASSLSGKELKIKSILSIPKSSSTATSSISSTDSCLSSPQSPIIANQRFRYQSQAVCRQIQVRYKPIGYSRCL